MALIFPDGTNEEAVNKWLRRIPAQDHEDAVQHAWVKYLEGKKFVVALSNYWRDTQTEFIARQIKFNEDGEPYVIDADGQIRNLPAANEQQPNASTCIGRHSLRKAG